MGTIFLIWFLTPTSLPTHNSHPPYDAFKVSRLSLLIFVAFQLHKYDVKIENFCYNNSWYKKCSSAFYPLHNNRQLEHQAAKKDDNFPVFFNVFLPSMARPGTNVEDCAGAWAWWWRRRPSEWCWVSSWRCCAKAEICQKVYNTSTSTSFCVRFHNIRVKKKEEEMAERGS